jgi:hypothetical protein
MMGEKTTVKLTTEHYKPGPDRTNVYPKNDYLQGKNFLKIHEVTTNGKLIVAFANSVPHEQRIVIEAPGSFPTEGRKFCIVLDPYNRFHQDPTTDKVAEFTFSLEGQHG